MLLQVQGEQELLRQEARLEEQGIRSEVFFEPDDAMGYSALATEPLPEERRRHFRKLGLWSGAKLKRGCSQ